MQDDPNGQWARDHREEFLDEILRHDGRGDYMYQVVCAGDGNDCGGVPEFRCSDCLQPCLYCRACIVSLHKRTPLHHLEVRLRHLCGEEED